MNNPYTVVEEGKRTQYWESFLENTKKKDYPTGVTDKKIQDNKEEILKDDDFWFHVLMRQGADNWLPERLREVDMMRYESARGQFWLILHERIVK